MRAAPEALTSCSTLADALERLLDNSAGPEESEAPMIWHEIVETEGSELCGVSTSTEN